MVNSRAPDLSHLVPGQGLHVLWSISSITTAMFKQAAVLQAWHVKCISFDQLRDESGGSSGIAGTQLHV